MKEQIIASLNSRRPQFLKDLGGTVIDVDPGEGICKMEFNVGKQYCHSVDVVQGGFVSAMLDAVTSHAVFASHPGLQAFSSLELKVQFYKASRAGKLLAVGRIDKMGRSIAFLSGDLFNEAGLRTASITTTAKISIAK